MVRRKINEETENNHSRSKHGEQNNVLFPLVLSAYMINATLSTISTLPPAPRARKQNAQIFDDAGPETGRFLYGRVKRKRHGQHQECRDIVAPLEINNAAGGNDIFVFIRVMAQHHKTTEKPDQMHNIREFLLKGVIRSPVEMRIHQQIRKHQAETQPGDMINGNGRNSPSRQRTEAAGVTADRAGRLADFERLSIYK